MLVAHALKLLLIATTVSALSLLLTTTPEPQNYVVLREDCPQPNGGGYIYESNIPQPYRGIRCKTNHTGIVQTYVMHEIVYCLDGKKCSCNNTNTFLTYSAAGSTNQQLVCNYTTKDVNDYLCGCCDGYWEVDKACVRMPATLTTTAAAAPGPPPVVVRLQTPTAAGESTTTAWAAAASPQIWPYVVGGVLAGIALIAVVVLLLIYFCCCCCCAVAAAAAPESEKKSKLDDDAELSTTRMGNLYVVIGESTVSKTTTTIESDYDVIAKAADTYEKIGAKDGGELGKISAYGVNGKLKSGTHERWNNLYSDDPLAGKKINTAVPEHLYDELTGTTSGTEIGGREAMGGYVEISLGNTGVYKNVHAVGVYKKEKSTDCDSALIPLLCVHG